MLCQAARLRAAIGFGDGLFILVPLKPKAHMHREVSRGDEGPTEPSGHEDADDKCLCLAFSRKQAPQSDGSKNDAVHSNSSASDEWNEQWQDVEQCTLEQYQERKYASNGH
jgi:hypothetical protein